MTLQIPREHTSFQAGPEGSQRAGERTLRARGSASVSWEQHGDHLGAGERSGRMGERADIGFL